MNWKSFLTETTSNIAILSNEIPETISAFNAMGREAKKPGALDVKTKEFIALGIAIATRCDSCIGFHVKSLVRLGTTRSEISDALAMCAYMGGGPSITFSAKALQAYDEFSED